MKTIIEGWSFPIDIDQKSGQIKTVYNNEVVKQSVNMILKTQIMEHKVFSDYGSELKSFMFGIVDSNYIHSFKESVEKAISRWEPHVIDMKIEAKSNSGPISRIEVDIEYITDISPEVEKTKKSINFDI